MAASTEHVLSAATASPVQREAVFDIFRRWGYLQATLDPLRILAAFMHRVLHLTAHMNMFVPVMMTCAALLLDPRPDGEGLERASISRGALGRILALLLALSICKTAIESIYYECARTSRPFDN